jgi:hypothetical protein
MPITKSSHTDTTTLEKLAHSLNLLYELIERVESSEAIKGALAGLTAFPLVKADYSGVAKNLDKITQSIEYEPKYKDAISTLKKEFGNILSVREALDKLYTKIPALKEG